MPGSRSMFCLLCNLVYSSCEWRQGRFQAVWRRGNAYLRSLLAAFFRDTTRPGPVPKLKLPHGECNRFANRRIRSAV